MANIATRYASALFSLAMEEGQASLIMEQAQFLCNTFEGEDGALRILTHPLISASEKDAFVDKVYGEFIHQDLIGFIKLAIAKNRESFILSAFTKLIEMIKSHMFQTTANVVSAVSLSDKQLKELSNVLAKKVGKSIELKVTVDPTKIAGISVHIDGYFLDCTALTTIKNMRESFVQGSVTQ